MVQGCVDESLDLKTHIARDEVNPGFIDSMVSLPDIVEALPNPVHLGVLVLVLWGDTLAEVHPVVLLVASESCLELEASIDKVLGVVGDHHSGGLLVL